MPIKRRNAGFTIVELMIATVAFSLVLIIIVTGIIQFTNQYYKGITSSKTQATARAIMDDISQDIQFSPGTASQVQPTTTSTFFTPGFLCVGSHVYSYTLGEEVVDGTPNPNHQVNHALVVSNDTCPALPPPPYSFNFVSLTSPRELLGPNMRLAKLSVNQIGSTDLFQINVRVVYGDDDQLVSPTHPGTNDTSDPDMNCKAQVGSQFCAVAELSTTVEKRL